ncbi:MAG: 6-pyruvoyl tetrahydrobiopterin synthase [Legionellales bacterium]|nr:6-pyruvoyl tetrahydrobiopterin synthase [Legionellales bacterium]
MSPRLVTIHLHNDYLKFSAGHFTIFSATHREPVHGHTYQARIDITNYVAELGLSYDYRHYKAKARALCQQLNLYTLLPTQNPYLRIEKVDNYYHAHFDQEILKFLIKDVVLLPLANITLEELSHWFVQQLIVDQQELTQHQVQAIRVTIASGPGQSGTSQWSKNQ